MRDEQSCLVFLVTSTNSVCDRMYEKQEDRNLFVVDNDLCVNFECMFIKTVTITRFHCVMDKYSVSASYY